MPRLGRRKIVWISVLLGGLGCTRQPQSKPLKVEYGGCVAVTLPGPVCVLGADPKNHILHLWTVPPPSSTLEVLNEDNRQLKTNRKDNVGGGQRFAVEIPPNTQLIKVQATTTEARAEWSLKLSEDWIGVVARESNAIHQYIAERQFAQAQHALDRIHAWNQSSLNPPVKVLYNEMYYRGLLAYRTGDFRSALKELREAERHAERAGKMLDLWRTRQSIGLQLQALGRFDEAAAEFSHLDFSGFDSELSCSEKVEYFTNRGWTLLMAKSAGEEIDNPVPFLQKAQELANQCSSGGKDLKVNASINLALAHLQESPLSKVKQSWIEARSHENEATLLERIWLREIEAQIALRGGDSRRALEKYTQLLQKSGEVIKPPS